MEKPAMQTKRLLYKLLETVRDFFKKPLLTIIIQLAIIAFIIWYTVRQIAAFPLSILILLLWIVTVLYSLIAEFRHSHTKMSLWLKKNLYSSLFNSCLTLVIFISLPSILYSIIDYAILRATFSPSLTAPGVRPPNVSASWGVIPGAWKLLATGTLEPVHLPRVWIAFFWMVILAILTYITLRIVQKKKNPTLRKTITSLWLITPLVLFVLLVGIAKPAQLVDIASLIKGTMVVVGLALIMMWQKVIPLSIKNIIIAVLIWPVFSVLWGFLGQSGLFPPINPEKWGGLLLTTIITIFASVISFPIGVALAFGRKSQLRGIPDWFLWILTVAIVIWGLATSTPAMLSSARNTLEKLMAFWPLLIILITYLFIKIFKGNVIAASSTVFIEVIRGVPLITILFLAIVMAPLFVPEGVQLKNTWSVLIGYTLFNSVYLAEVLRGGLNAIPQGQYEAADAIGLNTIQKIWFVILPQAVQMVIPALVNLFVGLFKSTSIVGIVGLFDLMGIVSSVTGNPAWQGLRTELYIFAALIYFLGSYVLSSYSQRIERKNLIKKR